MGGRGRKRVFVVGEMDVTGCVWVTVAGMRAETIAEARCRMDKRACRLLVGRRCSLRHDKACG